MTNFTLTRTHFGPNSTLGRLTVDRAPYYSPSGAPSGMIAAEQGKGKFQCYTLEDAVREIPGAPVSEYKIKGRTAIPVGSYDLVIDYSNRFKRLMPLLVGVPGFSGVRIHAGNTHEDTEGCILVGNRFETYDGHSIDWIIKESRRAFDAFFSLLSKALEAGPCRIHVVGLPGGVK